MVIASRRSIPLRWDEKVDDGPADLRGCKRLARVEFGRSRSGLQAERW